MVFWIAILTGVLFVWLSVRRRFYETWILLFNVIVSIYVAIFLAPVVVRLTPAIEWIPAFKTALGLLVLGCGCFALLQGVSFVLLTGQFHVPFPRFFDIVLAGLLGFVAGFLILSFVGLVVTATPLSDHWLLSRAGFNRQAEQPNIVCIAWCCDRIHSIAGVNATAAPTRDAITRLLDEARREMLPDRRATETDANVATPARPGG